MNKAAYALPLLAALGVLTACTAGANGSGASGSGATGGSIGSTPAPDGPGTEVIRASATNLQAASVPVTASGVFTDTGTVKLPIGDERTITFRFARGNLVVLNATGPTAGPLHLNKTSCAFSRRVAGTYRVLAANSTGRYAGATGHGTYTIKPSGVAPKTSAGRCDASGTASRGQAHLTVRLRGPLTLNPGS